MPSLAGHAPVAKIRYFGAGNTAALTNLRPEQFFGGGSPTDAIGKPLGDGSIRAVKLQWPGACTSEFFYSAFDVLSAVPLNYAQSPCDQPFFELNHITAIPFMPAPDRVQLFVNVQLTVAPTGFETCQLQASALYELVLGAPMVGMYGGSGNYFELPWMSGEGVLSWQNVPYSSGTPISIDGIPVDTATDYDGAFVTINDLNRFTSGACTSIPWEASAILDVASVGAFVGFGVAEPFPIWSDVIEAVGGFNSVNEAIAFFMINSVRDQLNQATQSLAPQAFPTVELYPPEIGNYDGYWGYGCAITPPPDLSNLLYGFQRQKCSPNISYVWTGHGYTELEVNNDSTMCAEARAEFCNLIRLGIAAPTIPLGYASAYDLALNGPGCQPVAGDDSRVAALIVEADRIGLPPGAATQQPYYWRCVPTLT
jgi:hypothetical protein